MRTHWRFTAVVGIALVAATGVAAAKVLPERHAGPAPDGSAVTTYGWRVTPAGNQTKLGEKPFGAVLSPDGKYLAVSNDGTRTQSLSLVEAASGKVLQSLPYTSPEALFIGLAWSPDGTKLYAAAGGNDKIRVYSLADGLLTETTPITLPKGSFPAGLTTSADGSKLYVADNGSGGLAAVDTATGKVLGTVATGANPFTVGLTGDGETAYVSNWGTNTVSAVDTATLKVRATLTVGSHPTAIVRNPATGEMLVAVTDADKVIGVNPATDAITRTIDLAPYRHAPVGSSPQGLAIDGKTLYVANAGDNDVAVVNLANNHVSGLIPTGWYPTTVTVTKDKHRLLVTNAKGLGAGPNPGGPQPTNPVVDYSQYVGSMIMGTLSDIAVPRPPELAHYTKQVRQNDGFDTAVHPNGPANVVPARPGDPSPIKHVIYVVKENRTYDQVFGSLGKGDGDPALNLFGDESAPNHRQLARQFVTLDNFYADGAVSSDGWEWATGSESNAYNEHLWPVAYSSRGRSDDVYTNQATDPGKLTGDSRIWDRLDDAGISYRNSGMWAGGPLPAKVFATEPRLAAHTDPNYAAQNGDIKDVTRADEWIQQYQAASTAGTVPTMQFIRLANDHTFGTSVGKPTPKAAVADNDLALGRIVDAVSHSKEWKDTAIFVTEDDAQNGPDHVDAHRTVALVISPYTQTGKVDSTMYSTVAMMRTMELIAGIGPLTQFDAAATPMTASFTAKPDFTPYDARTPAQSLDEKNTAAAPLAAESSKMNFSGADLAPERQLNEAIWKSVKGADSPMPAPRGVPASGAEAAEEGGR
ncbi:bifunctional YncE family protein/alkaline phosphatase family protein [Kribbella pratensis]|uniref:YVTN family beta-propeller protein n=1 Tax=Kribbella pratensis TaxID=2512112 RepID=A0A4R8BJA3_9ACTN|nr:bifunctional YncE family protein/alkaline phosphatase family protein [Kribbella pratensis]TDW54504.1 YVTN family beta-propeller protein [Kribbella pratensis]